MPWWLYILAAVLFLGLVVYALRVRAEAKRPLGGGEAMDLLERHPELLALMIQSEQRRQARRPDAPPVPSSRLASSGEHELQHLAEDLAESARILEEAPLRTHFEERKKEPGEAPRTDPSKEARKRNPDERKP